MEPDAYRNLDTLGLPHPRSWPYWDLSNLPNDLEWVYVRAPRPHAFRGIQATAHLQRERASFFNACTSADVRIDEVVDSPIGCAVTTHADGRYLEFVVGHLSELLVRANLFGRYLLGPGPEAELRDVRLEMQKAESFISAGMLSHRPLVAGQTNVREQITSCLDALRQHMELLPPRLLGEVMFDRVGRPLFVDLKSHPWPIHYRPIFDKTDTAPIYGDTTSGSVYSGAHELPRLAELGSDSVIRLGRRPLLSHFMTYALRNGIRAISP